MRESQIVQSVMQDCQYVLSHLLPVCNLLVQDPKITYNYWCQDGFKLYCGVSRWISFILNSLIRWTGKRHNFIFSKPTFVTWYFCFLRKVCNMILLFSQKAYKGRYADFFPAREKWNNVINLWKKWKRNDFVSFKRQIFKSSINNY